MSAAQNTYTTEIATVVRGLADQLNTDYKSLPDDLTGASKTFFLDICSGINSPHDYKSAAPRTQQTMHRLSFQKILSALKQFPQTADSSVIIDGLYHVRRFSTRPGVPCSLFYDDKAVIAHDALIYVLRAIWEHPSVTHGVFKDVVGATCAYVPAHIISRFLHLVQPRRTSEPTLPVAAEAVIWRSTFGHSIARQSYLRALTQQLTSAKEDTSLLVIHGPRDIARVAPGASLHSIPMSLAAPTNVLRSTSTDSGVLLRIMRAQFGSYLADKILAMLPCPISGEESQRSQQPSPALPHSSNVTIEQENTKKAQVLVSSGFIHEAKKN